MDKQQQEFIALWRQVPDSGLDITTDMPSPEMGVAMVNGLYQECIVTKLGGRTTVDIEARALLAPTDQPEYLPWTATWEQVIARLDAILLHYMDM